MITETKEVYKCGFCRKLYQVKRYCLEHETVCFKNPDYLRACHSCVLLEKRPYTLYEDNVTGFSGDFERKVDILYCPKLKHFLYPPTVEAKGNQFDLGDEENKPMPKECEFQQTQID